jgi:ATP-dependent DNA ligase
MKTKTRHAAFLGQILHFLDRQRYIGGMLWRNSRGRPLNAPTAFIHPCQPTVAKEPPSGPGWAHELKHDGYRLQIHVRDGRVRVYTMNGNDWTKRYPRIVEEAARLRAPLIIDAEVVHLSADGVPDFDTLHSRTADENAVALAFDLLLSGECSAKRERAFSMLNTLRATATNFLSPFAISGLKAS